MKRYDLDKYDYHRLDSFSGCFGFVDADDDNSIDWHDCRDTFAEDFYDSKFLFDAGSEIEVARVIKYIRAIERKMGLKKRVKFQLTTCDKIVCVCPSKFWLNECRLSLFTILLRAGRKYKGSIKKCDSKEYLAKTRPAVKRFLSGHTKYAVKSLYEFQGWVKTFKKKTPEEVERMLK